jgi:hypothetical protein
LKALEIVIDDRFEGPPAIANGGYACGLVAETLAGPLEVRLNHPVPLGEPLTLRVKGHLATLRRGEQTLLEARSGRKFDGLVPSITPRQAERASTMQPGPRDHPFPNCFVCGPHRSPHDGLHILPGPVEGTDLMACTWEPDESLATGTGDVALRYVWAALDCPTYWPVAMPGEIALLGTLSVQKEGRVTPGNRYVVVAWRKERQHRKLIAGSALCTEEGEPVAIGEATWIKVDWDKVAVSTGVAMRPGSGL